MKIKLDVSGIPIVLYMLFLYVAGRHSKLVADESVSKNILGSQIIITIIIVFYLTLIKIQINDKTKSYT